MEVAGFIHGAEKHCPLLHHPFILSLMTKATVGILPSSDNYLGILECHFSCLEGAVLFQPYFTNLNGIFVCLAKYGG